MKMFTTIALALTVSLGLNGCSRAKYSYRYKLTLSVETPEGVKTGTSVVEINHYEVRFPHKGSNIAVTGEALYLDLGKGRRPLVTLLTRHDALSFQHYGLDVLIKVYDVRFEWKRAQNEGLATLEKSRGSRPIELNQLPELVSFADPHDPKTVMPVNAWNLEEFLARV